MNLGSIREINNVKDQYLKLAEEDENVALTLKGVNQYKHSIYFFIQAMEKYIKAKIFSKLSPENEFFRDLNKHHSIETAGDLLLKIYCTDTNTQTQIKNMFDSVIFSDIHFNKLHNNLRYPFYNPKKNAFFSCSYKKEDCEFIEVRLKNLKKFLNDLDKLLY